MARPGITSVLVTGSRDWDNWGLIREALEPFFGLDVTLIHGDARGADKMADYVWTEWGGKTRAVPANWDRFGKSAGIRRNEGMVLSLTPESSVVVAFLRDDSPGTTHCARFAEQRGLTVIKVPYAPTTSTTPVGTDTTADIAPLAM